MSEMDISSDREEGGRRLVPRSRLTGDHPEQDFLTRSTVDHPEQDFVKRHRGALGDLPQRDRENECQDYDSRNLEEFVTNIEQTINGVVLPKYDDTAQSEQPPTIYKVPREMKGSSEAAYLPVAVEIGLLSHRRKGTSIGYADEGYIALENYKWCCVRRLIRRHHLSQEEPGWASTILRRCMASLKTLEPRILASYPPRERERMVSYTRGWDTFGMVPFFMRERKQEIHLCMLLDGCFVLRRLLKYARIARKEEASTRSSGGGNHHDDDDDDDDDEDSTQLFGRCWVWGFVTTDLLLLENQIPFFVVQKLFDQLRTDSDETNDDVLVTGALRLFRSLSPQKLYSTPMIPCSQMHVHHLLHLFYISIGFPPAAAKAPDLHQHGVPPSELSQWIPCARELEEAGIRFRPRKGATSFLDVHFNGGILEIPELQLFDYSEPLFRNLIAFEQTYPFTPGHVTAYTVFMDCLVTSPEDMRLLLSSGVLVNQINGERDATGFFNRLCAEAHLASDRNYLARVIDEVNRYRRSRWPRWRAALVRNYFSNPWVATSLVAAVIILSLTVMQSFFAAYAYFKPPKQQ